MARKSNPFILILKVLHQKHFGQIFFQFCEFFIWPGNNLIPFMNQVMEEIYGWPEMKKSL